MISQNLVDQLICPATGQQLHMEETVAPDGSAQAFLTTTDGSHRYPVKGDIPRFVAADSYADSFGYQWNKYAKLQLDSSNGTSNSRDRFYSITEWRPSELSRAKVLDVGCGAGRFAEIALLAGAQVTAIDLSGAVNACKANLGVSPHLDVIQASIYDLPFRDGSFDYVYSIGVIQHTPDPERSVKEICKMVKPGGQIGLWIYDRNWKSYVGTLGFKYLFRTRTKRMSRAQVEKFSNNLEKLCWPINQRARHWGFPGKVIMRMLPVSAFYLWSLPLSDEDFRKWVRLDTFDMYSPAHDHPQKFTRVESWLREAGFDDIRRHPHPGVSVTATRQRVLGP
jgi:2-polyprenyl-3-methyl-5-hydroxy-6-metoxy-1,4-benzoquinol methylase